MSIARILSQGSNSLPGAGACQVPRWHGMSRVRRGFREGEVDVDETSGGPRVFGALSRVPTDQSRLCGGILTLSGSFVAAHREDILNRVRNVENEEKKDHPLQRIMKIVDKGGGDRIRTTSEHLVARMGKALKSDFSADLVACVRRGRELRARALEAELMKVQDLMTTEIGSPPAFRCGSAAHPCGERDDAPILDQEVSGDVTRSRPLDGCHDPERSPEIRVSSAMSRDLWPPSRRRPFPDRSGDVGEEGEATACRRCRGKARRFAVAQRSRRAHRWRRGAA